MKSYAIAKTNASNFANERNKTVYIGKALNKTAYRIYFDESDCTPHYRIIEEVHPAESKGKERS